MDRMFAGVPGSDRQSHLENVWDSANQFQGCWVGLWLVWLGLYIIWAISPPPLSKNVNAASIVGDVFNMLSVAALFLCYLVLAKPTTPSQSFQFPQKVFFTLVPLTCLGLSGLLFVNQPLSALEPIHWVEGLLSAVALALLVGRLDSGLLKTNPYLIGALFAYAAIQFAYGKFHEPREDWLFLVVTSFALLLKVLLFKEIRRIVHSGTLFWYMFEFRKMHDATPNDDIVVVAKNEFLRAIGMARPTNVIPFGPKNPPPSGTAARIGHQS